jgi:succinate dehydrogenase / fumarate reductase flavoprotein subunit
MRLISESVRGEGGRVWVPGNSSKKILFPDGSTKPCGKTGEPWYFLEEMYPAFGNLVPRDIGSREVLRVCELGLGVDGKLQVYLDVTHLPQAALHKLESVLDIYQKFTGDDPRKKPMKICPGVHYTMGGAWVDWPSADDPDRLTRFRQMTNLTGCFNIGESDYQFHGANRLGANSLLSCIFSGLVAGCVVPRYIDTFTPKLTEAPFKQALAIEEKIQKDLLEADGDENVHKLHDELSDWMVRFVSVKRDNPDLEKAIKKIKEIRDRYSHIGMSDRGKTLNQTYVFAHQFKAMIEIALVIAKGALLRNEFRGAHFKPDYPNRDDEHWLKTTIATYAEEEPKISYEPVDMRHLDPIKRDYTQAKMVKPTLKNIPTNIELPL